MAKTKTVYYSRLKWLKENNPDVKAKFDAADTNAALAASIGITRMTLFNWLNPKREFSVIPLESGQLIAGYFGVELFELFGTREVVDNSSGDPPPKNGVAPAQAAETAMR